MSHQLLPHFTSMGFAQRPMSKGQHALRRFEGFKASAPSSGLETSPARTTLAFHIGYVKRIAALARMTMVHKEDALEEHTTSVLGPGSWR